jgi:uncharacterized protein (DUF2267 family)
MDVDPREFLGSVEGEAGISRREAEAAVEATLRTLAERITRGEAQDIGLELPLALREPLFTGRERPPRFPVDEFIRRVALREHVSEAIAAEHARAVFAAMSLYVNPKELHDMARQLPADYVELFPNR